jgi:hypothetical protein
MWNLLKANGDCDRFRILLEDSASAHPEAKTVGELTGYLPDDLRAHFKACGGCQEAAQDLLTAREIVRKAVPAAGEASPWFAERVMAAIAVHEQELEDAARTWLVVPRFASRLALASAAVLLIASTWLYESRTPEKINAPAATAVPEYLFEAPNPPINQDDVLISMAERNP